VVGPLKSRVKKFSIYGYIFFFVGLLWFLIRALTLGYKLFSGDWAIAITMVPFITGIVLSGMFGLYSINLRGHEKNINSMFGISLKYQLEDISNRYNSCQWLLRSSQAGTMAIFWIEIEIALIDSKDL